MTHYSTALNILSVSYPLKGFFLNHECIKANNSLRHVGFYTQIDNINLENKGKTDFDFSS